MQATRFHVVASLIGLVAVVALLALAYDNASKGVEESQTSLIQEYLDDDSSELQAIKKQQAELALKEKMLMSKLAAKKIASKQDSKIEKLKQELAAAEAAKKGGSDSSDSDSDSSDKSSSDAEDQSTVQSLVTANDFKKLPEPVAKNTDNHIAKEAGLKPMGWMGSKEEIDDTLRKYGCDPTSFVCKGSPAQKKIIAKKLQELQATLMGDGKQVQAYGWKEEHALPPAPKM
jgi:hypothetical protein